MSLSVWRLRMISDTITTFHYIRVVDADVEVRTPGRSEVGPSRQSKRNDTLNGKAGLGLSSFSRGAMVSCD